MIINTKEQIMELTKEWKGERLDDGRPKVPDHLLDKLRTMTLEENLVAIVCERLSFSV